MKKKILKNLQLLNPKNLANEVHVYGYHFSWKTHILTVLCSLLGIGAIGILFKLKPVYSGVILVIVCLMLPVFILNMYRRMFEQKRFADAVTYAEQILYSFQKSGKVVSALKETREIFEDGRMKKTIGDAIEYLESGNSNAANGILREALEIIESPYQCVKLHMVHELLISSEEYGGDMSHTIAHVLNDIELWKRRGYKLQADKKTSHADNMVSIAVATIMCAIALYVLNAMGEMFPGTVSVNIFEVGIIQISSFLFIIFMLCIYTKSTKSLTENWLQSEALHDEAFVLSGYETVLGYDSAREGKKSILLAVPFFIGAAVTLYFGYIWIGVICILAAAFMLGQHRIGYRLAKKDVDEELYIELPQWLMEMALLLQNNNVQVSIGKSIQNAPPLLSRELEKLTERLKKEPDKLRSYTDFCKDFDVPEVQSCMKMLHAMSESGTGNAGIQINNLILRVHEMQNLADNIRAKDIAFKMRMIFNYPILVSTVKLLVDLTLGMIFMFQLLGSMGG